LTADVLQTRVRRPEYGQAAAGLFGVHRQPLPAVAVNFSTFYFHKRTAGLAVHHKKMEVAFPEFYICVIFITFADF
jgi:hypothetical protein